MKSEKSTKPAKAARPAKATKAAKPAKAAKIAKPLKTDKPVKADKPRDEALALHVAELALDIKALNVVVLDLRERSSYTDFLVIASGTSDRHVQSIAESVADKLRSEKVRPIGSEGLREGQWALLDFGSVVLHVFHQFTRDVYQLENLWKDVPRLSDADTVKSAAPKRQRRSN